MQLTIILNDKSKQIINMSDKALMKNEKQRKSPQEIHEMCKTIASDVSRDDYESILIS
jgi:hypothetical protein